MPGTAKNVQKMTQVETKKSANAPAVAGTKRPALLLENWGAYRLGASPCVQFLP
jgi:hypothetical protein